MAQQKHAKNVCGIKVKIYVDMLGAPMRAQIAADKLYEQLTEMDAWCIEKNILFYRGDENKYLTELFHKGRIYIVYRFQTKEEAFMFRLIWG